jgi:hypothetical protein
MPAAVGIDRPSGFFYIQVTMVVSDVLDTPMAKRDANNHRKQSASLTQTMAYATGAVPSQ